MLGIVGEFVILVILAIDGERDDGDVAEIVVHLRGPRALRQAGLAFGHGLGKLVESDFEVRRVEGELRLDDR